MVNGLRICLIFSTVLPLFAGVGELGAGSLTGRLADEREVILPLKQTDVSLDITANLVHAKVRQVFYNDSGQNLEAVYKFPLPADATVTGMTLVVGDRRIRSVVKEKQEAQATYQTAKAQGKKAALVAQVQANLFTTSVANFAPGEEIEVELTYLEQLPFRGRIYEVVVPTTFGPRYIPRILPRESKSELHVDKSSRVRGPNHDGPDLVTPIASTFADHLFSVSATVHGLPVRDIYSHTHFINVEETGSDSFQIELAGAGDLPNRDFVLKIELWEDETPRIAFVQSEGQEAIHGLLTVFPPLSENANVKPVPREVLFLIDTSGSMSGASIQQAREGLERCLDLLNPGDRFNITRFSHDYSSLASRPMNYDSHNLADALNYIDRLVATGGTEMIQALNHVLSMRQDPGFMRMVVFLTDGDVGHPDELMQLVRNKLGDTRIFAFGVGTAPNEFLLKRLAETGHGTSQFIRNHDDIGEVVADFFATINAPVLTDVQVTWKTPDGVHFTEAVAYPAVVPDVYLGRPLQLCYRYNEFFEGSIEVSGYLGDRLATYEFQTAEVPTSRHQGIETLFGQALIDDLMVVWTNSSTEQREIVREDVIRVATGYQLISRFTSRVAVEERVTTAGNPHSVAVPVLAKSGSAPAFAATATTDPLWLMSGLGLMLAACLIHCVRHLFRRAPIARA